MEYGAKRVETVAGTPGVNVVLVVKAFDTKAELLKWILENPASRWRLSPTDDKVLAIEAGDTAHRCWVFSGV